MSKLSVTVLMGGPDAERDVSIASGTAVVDALKYSGKFNVTAEVIDRPSKNNIARIKADIVFPVLHGPFGEGGPLQTLLENVGIPFIGSSSKTSADAMDKVITKQLAKDAGIQTPPWYTITDNQQCAVPPPLVIKPINDGSSLDMAICYDNEQFENAKSQLLEVRPTMLVESYIHGREITVGIIDGKALPIIEIVPPPDLPMYDYEAKYERDDTRYLFDSNIAKNNCVEDALKLYELMGIRDIARADFIIDDDGAWFLEINTMPGFTSHSLVPMAAEKAGITMPELCTMLVENAINRIKPIGI